jgi:hypothetical protein
VGCVSCAVKVVLGANLARGVIGSLDGSDPPTDWRASHAPSRVVSWTLEHVRAGTAGTDGRTLAARGELLARTTSLSHRTRGL